MVTLIFQLPEKLCLPPELGLPEDGPILARILNDHGARMVYAVFLAGLDLGALAVAPNTNPSAPCVTQPQVHPDMPEYQLPRGNWTSQN